MLLNYSRQAFRQTGTGHFAAVGGYHKTDGKLLLMDTARFKYPPHWVSVDKMLQALQEIAVAGDGKTDGDYDFFFSSLRKYRSFFIKGAVLQIRNQVLLLFVSAPNILCLQKTPHFQYFTYM